MIDDKIRDEGLQHLTNNADEVFICSQAPASYTEATSTHALSSAEAISFGSPADYAGGREVTSSSVSNGSVTDSDTATHVAVVDSSNSRLLVVVALAAPIAVLAGGTYNLTAFKVRIPD